MFEKACDYSELIEGKYDVAVVNRTLCLIVWPEGGEPRAFQGMCPHAKEPLADARFDGKNLECHHHDWQFDGATGKCIKGKPCNLAEYPLKLKTAPCSSTWPALSRPTLRVRRNNQASCARACSEKVERLFRPEHAPTYRSGARPYR